jgi:hypothetical protein
MIPALLALCPPWVVALPIGALTRVVACEDLPCRPATGSGALLGTCDDGGDIRAAWDLGRLLGVPGGDQAWVLLDLAMPLALRTGRCLSVVALPAPVPIPGGLCTRQRGLGCFPGSALAPAQLAALAEAGAEPLPLGLWVDPARLWEDGELALGRQAVAGAARSLSGAGAP